MNNPYYSSKYVPLLPREDTLHPFRCDACGAEWMARRGNKTTCEGDLCLATRWSPGKPVSYCQGRLKLKSQARLNLPAVA